MYYHIYNSYKYLLISNKKKLILVISIVNYQIKINKQECHIYYDIKILMKLLLL